MKKYLYVLMMFSLLVSACSKEQMVLQKEISGEICIETIEQVRSELIGCMSKCDGNADCILSCKMPEGYKKCDEYYTACSNQGKYGKENIECLKQIYGVREGTISQSVPKNSSLDASYQKHKRYIWHVCKEGVKVLNVSAKNFNGPTYAGEYMGELIIKGSSDKGSFRCVFDPANNQRGMNLKEVTWES